MNTLTQKTLPGLLTLSALTLALLGGPACQAQGSAAEPAPATSPDDCRTLSDKAMTADVAAAGGLSRKLEPAQLVPLYEQAVTLWAQAVPHCQGRARERAERNLLETQRVRQRLSADLGDSSDCQNGRKEAEAMQELARQALTERRWADSATLFHKAEDLWDVASERCTGPQRQLAESRREQTAVDGHNAEHCAPLFEKARLQTQQFRSRAAGLSRPERQDASMEAEGLWRQAQDQCRGSVTDLARNNAQTLAKERGTAWVARPGTEVAAKPGTASAVTVAPATTAPATLAAKPATPSSEPQAERQQAEFTVDGTVFKGQWVRDAGRTSLSGQGLVRWANGDSFEGSLVQGLRHGRGIFQWANGQRYEGDWVNDQPNGQAKVHFANGNDYEGAVQAGLPQGMGRMRYASGDLYTGQFKAGVPEGRGLYLWKSGQQFEGDWKNEQPHGEGRLQFASGAVYTGPVQGGQPHGRGRYSWPSGDRYEGDWQAGLKHGQGTFFWANGDRFEGRFENDTQGEGQLIRAEPRAEASTATR